jgi:hypothetical protein
MCRILTLWRIRLSSLALAVALAGAAGCDDGNGPDQVFEMDWFIRYLPDTPNGPVGQTVDCEGAGTPTLLFEIRNVATGAVFSDRFACNTYYGRSQQHPPGEYQVRLTLEDRAGRPIARWEGEDRTWFLRRRGSTYFGLPVEFTIQSFALSWSVAQGPAPVSCQRVGAQTVLLLAQLAAEDEPRRFEIPCAQGAAQTAAVPPGTYGIQVQLLNAQGAVLSQVRSMTVTAPANARAILPAITFEVAP